MTSLYIPFAHESIEPIELIEEEREDVIDQLDRRRAAIQEIEVIRQNAGEDETPLDVTQPIAVEANDTLSVLTRSILRNIKDVGLANENIAAIAINNDNVVALLNNYEKLYTSEEYTTFINKLIELTKVALAGINDQTLISVPDVEKILVTPDKTDNFGEFAVSLDIKEMSYDVSAVEYADLLPTLISKVVEISKLAVTGLSTLSGNTLEDWKTATIDSIDDTKVKAYAEYAIHINHSVSIVIADLFDKVKVTVEGLENPELTEEVNSLEGVYREICTEAEEKHTLDKAMILEGHMENLMAIEAFRDTTLGKMLAAIFRFVSKVFKAGVLGLAGFIYELLSTILRDITTGMDRNDISEITPNLQAYTDKHDSVIEMDVEQDPPIIRLLNKDNSPIYYKVEATTFAARLVEVPTSEVKGGNFNKYDFRTYLDVAALFTSTTTIPRLVNGLVIEPDKAIGIAVNGLNEVSIYRDLMTDYLKSNDPSKLIKVIDDAMNKIISSDINLFDVKTRKPFDVSDKIKRVPKPSSNDAGAIKEYCSRVIDTVKELQDLSKEKGDVRSVLMNDIGNVGVLRTSSMMLKNASNKANSKFSDLDKMLNNIKDDSINKDTVMAAQSLSKAMCAVAKLNMEVAYNSCRAIAVVTRVRNTALRLTHSLSVKMRLAVGK